MVSKDILQAQYGENFGHDLIHSNTFSKITGLLKCGILKKQLAQLLKWYQPKSFSKVFFNQITFR
jgi:hypothetical protein